MNSDIKNKLTTTKYPLHPFCTQQNLNNAKIVYNFLSTMQYKHLILKDLEY